MVSSELEVLVAQAQAGDAAAFEHVVVELQDMAVAYAVSLVGNVWEAEEIAQEAFFRAYLDLGSLREPGAFRWWFRRIVLTRCNRSRRRKQLPVVGMEAASGVESGEPMPHELVETGRVKSLISRAIWSLPEGDAMAISLHYMGEYSYREIAGFLEVPESTVKSRLFAARRRLRGLIGKELEAELQGSRPSRDRGFSGRISELVRAATVADPDGNEISVVEKGV